MVKVRVGRHRLQSLPKAVVGRDDGRPHRCKADALADGGLHRVVSNLGFEVAEGGDAGSERVHGMAILNYLQYLNYAVWDNPVVPQQSIEIGQFLLVGELAIEKEIDHFLEGRLLSQVVVVVASVEQFAFYAVDETGLGGVEIDILESSDDLWGHGSTFLQEMRRGRACGPVHLIGLPINES